MKTLSKTNWKKRLFITIAIVFAFLLAWLVGGGMFRQSAPKPSVLASPALPDSLNTAADYLAQGDYESWVGNYDKAIAAYTRAIELDPKLAQAYNNRAYTHMLHENYAPALSDLNKALELRPDYVNALMNRGDIYNYYYQIDYDRAIADYDRVLAIDPEAPQHTSVCGHRMLALHHGWSPGVLVEVLTRGAKAGCPEPPGS